MIKRIYILSVVYYFNTISYSLVMNSKGNLRAEWRGAQITSFATFWAFPTTYLLTILLDNWFPTSRPDEFEACFQ